MDVNEDILDDFSDVSETNEQGNFKTKYLSVTEEFLVILIQF